MLKCNDLQQQLFMLIHPGPARELACLDWVPWKTLLQARNWGRAGLCRGSGVRVPHVLHYGAWNEGVTATMGWQREKTHTPTGQAL